MAEGENGVISFEDVSLDELAAAEPRKSSEVGKMIEQFLNTGRYAAAPNLGADEANTRRAHGITVYARRWGLPIRALYKNNKVILKRVDITQDGTAIPNWQEGDEFKGNPNRRKGAAKGGATRKANAERTPEGANATRPRQPVAAGG